jgi:hypothetical protein
MAVSEDYGHRIQVVLLQKADKLSSFKSRIDDEAVSCSLTLAQHVAIGLKRTQY